VCDSDSGAWLSAIADSSVDGGISEFHRNHLRHLRWLKWRRWLRQRKWRKWLR
jgi:hypothetical protein